MLTYGLMFRTLSFALAQTMNETLSSLELTFSQGHILGYLAHCQTPPCAKNIEERFQLSHPTVSGLLSRLERKGFLSQQPDPQDRRRKLALIRRFLKGSRAMFAVSILCAAVTSLADMVSPQIIRIAVDHVIGGKEADLSAWVMALVERAGGFAYLGQNLWIMAAAVILVALFQVLSQYAFRVNNAKASETLVKTMRDQLFGHIERLPFSWHMKNRTGDIIQRCTSDIDTTKNFLLKNYKNNKRWN